MSVIDRYQQRKKPPKIFTVKGRMENFPIGEFLICGEPKLWNRKISRIEVRMKKGFNGETITSYETRQEVLK
jgi:hypothetical protein